MDGNCQGGSQGHEKFVILTRGAEAGQLFNLTQYASFWRVLPQSGVHVSVHPGCGELTRAD